jgi:hypothetical protein
MHIWEHEDKTYKTKNLPVVLYVCETWSLTMREEHRLRAMENRMLRSKRDEVAGVWWKLHNEELCDLNCSPNILRAIKSRWMRWIGYVARKENRNTYRALMETWRKMATSRTFVYVKELYWNTSEKEKQDEVVDGLPCVCDFHLCVDYESLGCGSLTLKMEIADFSDTMAPF